MNYLDSKQEIDELLKYLKQNRFSNIDKTIKLCEKAYSLSSSINYNYGMGLSKMFHGEALSLSGNYQDGIKYILYSTEIAEKINNMKLLAASYNSLANSLFELSNFEKALEHYNNVLKIAKENSFIDLIAIAYNNIGEIFRELNCQKEALEHYKSSVEIDEKINFKGCKGASLINLGYYSYLDEKYNAAYDYTIKALKMLNSFEYCTGYPDAFNTLALISWKTNNLKDADKKFMRALALSTKYNCYYSKIMILKDYYQFLIENNDYDRGIEILQEALDTCENNDLSTYIAEICNLIAGAYEKKGNNKKAFHYLKLYNQYNENNKVKTIQQRATSIKAQNILEKTKIEKENLQNTVEKINHLNNLGKKITSTLDLNKIVELLLETIRKYMDANTFGIGFYNEENEVIDYNYFIEDGIRRKLSPKSIYDKNSLAASCLRNKEFVVINDFSKDSNKYISTKDIYYGRNRSINSIIYAPLIVDKNLIGVLSAQSHKKNAFTEHSIEAIETITSYAAIALNNSIKSKELKEEINIRRKAETKLLIANEALDFLSKNDALTQIPNRRSFDRFLNDQWNYHLKNKKMLSLILIDVDSFKEYNDNYGHVQGDKCLKSIAKILRNSLKKDYFVARYGGDEFAIILPSTQLNEVIEFGEEIRLNVVTQHLTHEYSDVAKHVTITLGVASLVPNNNISINSFIRNTDQALYSAKKQGRNQLSSYNLCFNE